MNKLFLTAVSAIALVAAVPAQAADNDMDAKADVKAGASIEPGSAEAAAQSTGSVKTDVKNAWEDIKHDTAEAYEDVKATVVGETRADGDFKTVTIDERMTASGMISRPVYNTNGESVATVKDIILDRDGKAIMIVVADGEFIGMGKKAVFDYNAIARINADGDVIMPLTEEMIDNAAEFSYDREDYSDNVTVIPSNGYSVSALLDGQLVNQDRKKIAQIDNISFRNGHADQLIVGFDKILGLGGEKAALQYDDAKLIRDGEGYDFQLSTKQTAQFETYKKNAHN